MDAAVDAITPNQLVENACVFGLRGVGPFGNGVRHPRPDFPVFAAREGSGRHTAPMSYWAILRPSDGRENPGDIVFRAKILSFGRKTASDGGSGQVGRLPQVGYAVREALERLTGRVLVGDRAFPASMTELFARRNALPIDMCLCVPQPGGADPA